MMAFFITPIGFVIRIAAMIALVFAQRWLTIATLPHAASRSLSFAVIMRILASIVQTAIFVWLIVDTVKLL